MEKQNGLVNEYVHHLPEVGPEVLGRTSVTHVVYYHNDWCRIYDGKACICDPRVRLFAEPNRS